MQKKNIRVIITGLSIFLLSSCTNSSGDAEGPALFTLLSKSQTHVDFSNDLKEGLNTNVLMYEYFYNGGGVAAGDLNDDGLDDIYFTGNMVENRLYLNKGNMEFADITNESNTVGRPGPWKTGVTMADVNGDKKLDIYVCYSGKLKGSQRANQLFINKGTNKAGIPAFSEEAALYGLADTGYSTQGYFFDHDRDGDLDMLLLNHNPNSLKVLDEAGTFALLNQPDPSIGVRLFRNDDNHFTDATVQSGISSSSLTYGLGAGIADIDGDGWQDIYISNDYTVPDYYYINNHDGTFTDHLKNNFAHVSQFSMGNAITDVNNDALPDVYTLDMLPEDNRRQKLLFAPDNYEKFELTVRSGFHFQYMRNMLQVNNGNGSFSETGQLSGISNTDWSWAPLFADYDNDGWKDLFVTNGYTRDYTNMDFLKYMNGTMKSKGKMKRDDILEIVKEMPSSNVVNYMYKNNGNLTFQDMSSRWGVTEPSNSNGGVYADLDNDGDLDLVVNNINKSAFIYRNEADSQTKGQYLKIKLDGSGKNTYGIGAQVYVYNKNGKQWLQQMPATGYQSSVSPVLHMGLGKDSTVDSLRIVWATGKEQLLTNIKSRQVLTVHEKDAEKTGSKSLHIAPIYREIKPPVNYVHAVNNINDFKRQPLMVNPLSFSGPCIVKGDVNGDGKEDIYAGAGSGKPASLFIQMKDGNFREVPQPAFEKDLLSEDADAIFLDVNKDGFNDLYVASGGYHNYGPADKLLQDRLYINDGKGNFTRHAESLPEMLVSKGCVRAADINGDGNMDLFVGGRNIPGRYPESPASYILINDGKGNFKDLAKTIAPDLQNPGMITDAAWTDMNNDGISDLIVVGEWMPVSVYINVNGKLENRTAEYFDKECTGWWNKIYSGDLNGDGRSDLVIGNTGLNTQCRATTDEPVEMYYKDFDKNGAVDPILCLYVQRKSYPYVTRDELFDQITAMRTRFADYKSYANATMKDMFIEEDMKNVKYLKAICLATTYFERGDDGRFHEKKLPVEAQLSPVFSITPLDYNKDGHRDLLVCGNINQARLRFGNSDANYGMLLKNDGKGNFTYVRQIESGFKIRGDVRSVLEINNTLLFGINQQPLKAYKQ